MKKNCKRSHKILTCDLDFFFPPLLLCGNQQQQMQHIAVKSNLVETTTAETKLVFGENNVPLCPKPRRPGIPPLPEFLSSLGGCNNHNHSQVHSDGRSEILNMITEKTAVAGMDEGESSMWNGGCSLSCYSGSPPGRTDNPLVHDVQFIHQMDHYSQYTRQQKMSDKFGFFSASQA